MKKLALLTIVLFLVLGVGTLSAQMYGRAFAVKIDTATDGEIKLDGVLDKENEPWKFAIPIYIVVDDANGGILTPIWQQFGTHAFPSVPATKHRGIFDTSAIVYILWDAKNLYVATAEYDDVIGKWGPNAWESDSYELYLGSALNFGNVGLRVELSYTDGKTPSAPIPREPDVMKSAVKIDFDGGRLWTESIIDLKRFGIDGTKIEGKTVTFDFEIDDVDDPNFGNRHKIAWSGGQNHTWDQGAMASEITFLGYPPKEYR